MLNRFYVYILTFIALLASVSCQDDFPMQRALLADGESDVAFSVSFKDFTPALDSRSDGDAMRKIRSLWVAVYKSDGKFVKLSEITDYSTSEEVNKRPDGSLTTESYTGRASFTMRLHNGLYRIYAIANTDLTSLLDTEPTEDDLRSVSLRWDSVNPTANDQMFGYFDMNSDRVPEDFIAPEVTVAREARLHAWLRRAASKVTVAFDTQNLHDNVYIYIRSVRLVDIPKECYLGRDNTPASAEDAETAERKISNTLIAGERIFLPGANAQQDLKNGHEYQNVWLRLVSSDTVKGLNPTSIIPPDIAKLSRSQQLSWLRANQHSEKAPAMYFFENRQPEGKAGSESDKRQDVKGKYSEVTYPDGVKEGNDAWKDARPYGTYLEVDGYYECNDAARPGRGPIRYRFMLGKNETTSYDAERNYHYRVTLRFNGYANDVDFHIDFDDEGKPGFITPPEAYVPYLYNQRSFLVARATPKKGYRLKQVEAVIVKNEWRPHAVDAADEADLIATKTYNKAAWDLQQPIGYDGDNKDKPIFKSGTYYQSATRYPLYYLSGESPSNTDANCEFGFLSLRNIKDVDLEFGGHSEKKDSMVKKMREKYYKGYYTINGTTYGTPDPIGHAIYDEFPTTFTGPEGMDIKMDDAGSYYNVVVTSEKMSSNPNEEYEKTYILQLPLYTRAKSLDPWAVYSGANPFYQHNRLAVVRYRATYVSEADPNNTYSDPVQETMVYQSRRIDNPRAIYRRSNNLEGFHIDLSYMHLDGTTFESEASRGEWSATIEADPEGIVMLAKNGQTVTGEGGMVHGRTGSTVNFWYYPRRKLPKDKCAGAIITVRYHNNTCVHKIIVRQGYAAIQLIEGGRYWSMFNVYDTQNLTKSPLSQGSYFKRVKTLQSDDCYPICESNNYRVGMGAKLAVSSSATFDIAPVEKDKTPTRQAWTDIPSIAMKSGDVAFGTFTMIRFDGDTITYECPSHEEAVREVLTNNETNFAFGIVYADGATATLKNENAYSFQDPYNLGDDLDADMKKRGVRAIVVYSLKTGSNTIFPLGASGFGRRRYSTAKDFNAYGALMYGSWHKRLEGGNNDYRPLAYNLPDQFGALYWFRSSDDKNNLSACFDYNYANYNTGALPVGDIYAEEGKSDALLIKPVSTDD